MLCTPTLRSLAHATSVAMPRGMLRSFSGAIDHETMNTEVSKFITHHFRHFNGAVLVDAANAYHKHIDDGGKMFLSMAGAMSTAEIGEEA